MSEMKSSKPLSRDDLLEKARLEREARQGEKKRNASATIIQRAMKSWVGRRQTLQELRRRVDDGLNLSMTGVELFRVGKLVLFVYSGSNEDKDRFNKFCRALLESMKKDATKAWYVSVSLRPKLSPDWIKQLKTVLLLACKQIKQLKFGLPMMDDLIKLYLELIVLFTDYTLWKFTEKAGKQVEPMLKGMTTHVMEHLLDNGFYAVMRELLVESLSSPVPTIPSHCVSAAMAIRQLALSNFSVKMMVSFVKSILTIPGSLLYLQKLSPETLKKLEGVKFVNKLVSIVHSQPSCTENLDANDALSLFGNLIYLSSTHVKVVSEDKEVLPQLLNVLTLLIQRCEPGSLTSRKTTNTTWHPFFGWTTYIPDKRLLSMLDKVRVQLQNLWCGQLVQSFFAPVLGLTPAPAPQAPKSKIRFTLFKKTSGIKLNQSVLDQANKVCRLYDSCFSSLKDEVKMDVLIGLGCNGALVSKMWHFLWLTLGLDVDKIVRTAAKGGGAGTSTSQGGGGVVAAVGNQDPLFSVITLCCQTTQYRLVILDDDELFVQQKQFSIEELVEISSFLNRLVFRLIMEGLTDTPIFPHCHALLMLLHSRDGRRPFTEPGHWLIKSLKLSNFMSELKAGKPRAVKLVTSAPHTIPLKKRLEVFQHRVTEDRVKLGIPTSRNERSTTSTYIDIHRRRVLEDGYAQLASVTPKAFKGTIRVKFINEQGLEEAGIDETGVFKEFLEEVIKIAFDPNFSLFKVNGQGHLYPSPTSYVQDNHLTLFEFVGKMLGKALYEGIVVDVPFAPFFLSQMLERHFSAAYSCLDELPSMDSELYKSLSYIKHEEGDASDLCLTFSWDENFMGKVVTHELIPGGCGIPVTNENRISYVHHVALFRMYTQIKKQSMAFIRGFHSVIDKSFIACFSPQELQHLISGNQTELDVEDLRAHTQYYGGYHNNHKVIVWLWDIVKNDFNAEEKAAFLKFVTSCSKSPLLGFDHMQPPFSIRCVEVPDEEDEGDSLVSMVKGLLSIRKRGARDRLPTASTCFNLLKLPNYTRKAVLREKLRYALASNAGFELS